MKTFRIITAMVLVVGLIGVFCAIGAEQTSTGKQGTPVTEKKESQDQKKGPTPGSTTMQAPAATMQSLPLTIKRLYVKDGKVHVVIKKPGGKRLSDEDYEATKLKVEGSTLKKPLEWTLLEVDPHKRFTRRIRREQDFDTGLAVTARVRVKATLYRGLWKTAKEETLSPMMAKTAVKTRMGTPEKEDKSRDQVLLERETPPATAASKTTMMAPSTGPGQGSRGIPIGIETHSSGFNHGIVVEQPRWGAVYVEGERIQVLWRLEEEIPGRLWRNVRISLRGVGSFDRELYTRWTQSGTAVEVELPEDCEEGFDYVYRIRVQDVMNDDVYGESGAFTLVSRTGGLLAFAAAWDDDATPTSIKVLKPNTGQVPWRLASFPAPNLRIVEWWVFPIFIPVHKNFELQCFTEDGTDEVGESIEISYVLFDHESRVYRTGVDIEEFGLEPGRYRLEVRLVPQADDDFPAVSGRSSVFRMEPAIPLQILRKVFWEEGCIQVMEPGGNTSIHAGTDLRVRWEFCPELEELVEFATGPFGSPLRQYVLLYAGERDREDRSLVLEQRVANHARSYDLPLPRNLTAGTYHVEVEARVYLTEEPAIVRGTSDNFTILRP